jgi:DNA methyltransferase 1-associated protein 1
VQSKSPVASAALLHLLIPTTTDYKFAKFNKTPVILEYTKEQYDQHFQDPDWSKDETDYLLAMCRQYDTRFIIIHDRWHRTPRSVEDLKERFYNVQRKLLQLDANTAEDHPLLKFPFNRGKVAPPPPLSCTD